MRVPKLVVVFLFSLFAFPFSSVADERAACINQIRTGMFGQFQQARMACEQCMVGTSQTSQCESIAQSWCYSSGKCSQRGSGCEVVPGCKEAMEAKNPKGEDQAQFQSPNRCEEGLVQGKKDQRQCFCPVDKDQKFSTDSASQCGEVAQRVAQDKQQAHDQQDSDMALRQCEILKSQAEQCCRNPESCMKAKDLKKVEQPKPGEAIHVYCKRLRDAGNPNRNANNNAGAVCTRAYSKCQSECSRSAAEYSKSEIVQKLDQAAKSCSELSTLAQLLGGQGLESGAGSFGGELCSDKSMSFDQIVKEHTIERQQKPEQRETGETPTPPESEESGGIARYLDMLPKTQKPRAAEAAPSVGFSSGNMATLPAPEDGPPEVDEEYPNMPKYWAARFDGPRSAGPSANALAAQNRIRPGQQYYIERKTGSATAGYATAGYATASVASGITRTPATAMTRYKPASAAQPGAAKEGQQKGQASAVQSGSAIRLQSLNGRATLAQYLPGGKKDPRAHIAGAAPRSAQADIHGRHTNIFEVITEIMSNKCESGELLDCQR